MSEPLPHLFQVGDWQADANQNLMWHGSREIHLEPKTMAILQFLVMNANEVVSREVLFAKFWKNQVVTEDALNRAMWNIRRSLGDTPNNPKYIATIRNRGYKLIAPTTVLEDPRVKAHQASVQKNREKNLLPTADTPTENDVEKRSIAVAPQENKTLEKPLPKRWKIYSSITLVSLLLIALMVRVINIEGEINSSQKKLNRITYSQAQNIMPVLSLNGESLIYVARTQGIPNQLKLLNNLNNQTYHLGNSKHNYSHPTFNKDNASIAVVVDKSDETELEIININSHDKKSVIALKQTSHGLSWHPKQNLLTYTQPHPTTGKVGIFTIHTELKQPQVLTDSGTGIKDLLPKFSPSGKEIAFIRHFSDTEQALFIVDLQGKTTRLSDNFSKILSYVWLNEKELLLSLPKGTYKLSRLGVLTRESINNIENNNFSTSYMHFSPKDSQLLFSQTNYSAQVVNYSLKDANLGHDLTRSQANDIEGIVSSNGHNLAFVSNRTGEKKVWLLQGNKLSHIESSIADYIYDLRWSPDSNKLIAVMKIKADYYLFTYHVDSAQSKTYSLGLQPVNIADWQTNQSILLTKRQNEHWYLFQYDIEAQQQKKLSELDIYQARLTPDKRRIIFTSEKSSGVWLWDQQTPPKLISNSAKLNLPSNWFVDDEYIYYLTAFDNINQSQLWQVDLLKGEQRRMGVYPMLNLSSRSQHKIYSFTASKISQLHGDVWSVNIQP